MEDDLFDSRLTERGNPGTANIDSASPLEIVDLINAEDRCVPDAVHAQREPIARAIEIAVDCLKRGGRLIYVGAGTSGRLGVLDATECPPTFGTDPDTVQGIIAGGYMALVRSQEGAEDRAEEGAAAIDDTRVGPDDFVIGIATSSTTPFVRAAVARAKELGARTGFLCCTEPGDEVRDAADVCVVPLVGPEVIAGSTRMKAGTATKLVLNTISTGAMILLGKVYRNLMVDLQAVSEKLVDRGERIVMTVTGCTREDAHRAIEDAGGSVKLALVMQAAGAGRELAELYLSESGGFVRAALETAEAADRSGDGSANPYALYAATPPAGESLELTLEALRGLPRRISDRVASAPNDRLRERPAEDKWCAKEHVEHLIDVDEVMARRIRTILAEDVPAIADRDDEKENARTIESGARGAPIRMLLRRLTDGRAALVAQVEAVDASAFGRTGRHEVYGPISVYQILRHLTWHDDHHVRAIRKLVAN